MKLYIRYSDFTRETFIDWLRNNGSSSRTTTIKIVETISLEDATAIIAKNMTPANNHDKYSNSLSQFDCDEDQVAKYKMLF